MSIKEAERLNIMRQIDAKTMTIRQGSEAMGICLRQAKRIRKRYGQDKEPGLVSRRRNRPSNRRIDESIKIRALELLRTVYVGFGPTLASEKLKEKDNIVVSRETLRTWMQGAKLWVSHRKKPPRVYQRRHRRERFGEMLQGDGSPHDWFEGRAPKCTLLQFVDDATSKITAAIFSPTETTEGYLKLLEEHVSLYGRPLSLYVDKHATFRVNREELLKGDGVTHFGRVAKALDIQLIFAHSPQAKGRIERKNGLLQDRLTKELRLQGISSIEAANAFLPSFLNDINKRFGREPCKSEDAHRAVRAQDNFQELCLRRDVRKLAQNLMFQHHGIAYMVQTNTPNRLRGAKINVLWKENAIVRVEYRGVALSYTKWADLPYEPTLVMNAKEVGILPLACSPTKKAVQTRTQNYLHPVGF